MRTALTIHAALKSEQVWWRAAKRSTQHHWRPVAGHACYLLHLYSLAVWRSCTDLHKDMQARTTTPKFQLACHSDKWVRAHLPEEGRFTLRRKMTLGKSSRPMTPVMTMAASAFSGMCRKTGVRHSSTMPIRAALTRPARPACSKVLRFCAGNSARTSLCHVQGYVLQCEQTCMQRCPHGICPHSSTASEGHHQIPGRLPYAGCYRSLCRAVELWSSIWAPHKLQQQVPGPKMKQQGSTCAPVLAPEVLCTAERANDPVEG